MPRRRKTHVIRRAEQLAALTAPMRHRIAACLSVHGPSSVRELAARLGRSPESLYYHVRSLVDVGLVVLARQRTGKRRPEAVYRLVAPRLMIDPAQGSQEYRGALADSASALLRLAQRNYRASARRPTTVLAGGQRNLLARQCCVRLDRDGLRRLNRALDDFFERLNELADSPGDPAYAVTVALSSVDHRDTRGPGD